MPLHLGSVTPEALYLGAEPVVAAHLGAEQVWPAGAAETYRDTILALSPIGYWRLGESSGTSAADETGNGHTGTYTGTYSLAQAGLITVSADTCVSFNGTNEGYVSVPDHAAWDINSFTVEAWTRPSTVSGIRQIIDRDPGGAAPSSRVLQLRQNGTSCEFIVFVGGQARTVSAASQFAADTTYHVAGVVSHDSGDDETTVTLYVNGAQVGTGTWTSATSLTSTQAWRFGRYGGSGQQFGGRIDEVAIYGAALSGAQVGANYDAGTA